MTKRLVLLVVGVIASYSLLLRVNADEIYYTNPNNVSMTEEQYDFFGEMFWDGFQEDVTQALFNEYLTYGYFDGEIETVEYEDIEYLEDELTPGSSSLNEPDSPMGTIHETTAKKLTLSKSCGTYTCGIAVTLQWKKDPTIKSYDVIGALLYGGVTLVGEPTTYLKYSGGTLSYGDEYYVGGGFGTSVKLQTSSTNMKIAQSFNVTDTGAVYASYQHATSNITKATSQLYTVGYGGYGGVFHFYGAASNVFDQMGGVNTTVSI